MSKIVSILINFSAKNAYLRTIHAIIYGTACVRAGCRGGTSGKLTDKIQSWIVRNTIINISIFIVSRNVRSDLPYLRRRPYIRRSARRRLANGSGRLPTRHGAYMRSTANNRRLFSSLHQMSFSVHFYRNVQDKPSKRRKINRAFLNPPNC